MFLIDDLLLAPGKALFYVLSELGKKAEEEWLDDEPIKQELRQIYLLLESGSITEQEFGRREHELLERLDKIARRKSEGR